MYIENNCLLDNSKLGARDAIDPHDVEARATGGSPRRMM
jgi:hypothetical protein